MLVYGFVLVFCICKYVNELAENEEDSPHFCFRGYNFESAANRDIPFELLPLLLLLLCSIVHTEMLPRVCP